MKSILKVGIFSTVALVVLAILIWKIEDLNPFGVKGQTLKATFRSVAGLDDKAAVRVAGVRVGRVNGVGLNGRAAMVTLVLDRPLDLPVGTVAKISNMGLLGDKYVEIIPGPEGGAPLPKGAVIPGITPPGFDEAMAKLEDIGSSIQKVTNSLTGGDLGGNISRLFQDIEATSQEIRLLVAENRANVGSTVRNFNDMSATLARELPKLSQQLSRALDQVADTVAENRSDLKGSLGNIKELTTKLQTSADNLNKISDKIASGQGTIGKLVNNDEAYNGLVSTLDSIKGGVSSLSDTLGAVRKFKLDLDLRGYYLQDSKDSVTTIEALIDPRDGAHLYRGGITSIAKGQRRDKTQTITVTNPDGTTTTTTIDNLSFEDGYVANALLGYQGPKDIRLWAGLIEGHGGVQAEYPFLKKSLWTSFEAFDFNRPNDQRPHLRLTGRYQLTPNLYLLGGYDDPFERKSIFFGGGLHWTDDSLKYILGSLPIGK
jgi:phospholipid/cholesterol/gamma-HCH transport system substrate-binding protein